MARKKKAPRALPKRNLAAKQAINQKSAVIPSTRRTRGGARNTMKEDLEKAD